MMKGFPVRIKALLAAAILMVGNAAIVALVLIASASGAVAQDETPTMALACDLREAALLEQQYLALVAARDSDAQIFDAAQFELARTAFLRAIEACAPPEGTPVRYDNGGVREVSNPDFQVDEFVVAGTKWGANSPFSTGSPPGTAGGTVTYSFMANSISFAAEGGSPGTSVAITSLPGFQACFLTDIRAAFAAWQSIANIQFIEVADSGAAFDTPGAQGHIRIAAHTFNGPGGTLAHAYFPPPSTDPGNSRAGDIHIDVAENWQCAPGAGFDIGLVVLHEIGHTLGLQHEPQTLAVMNATYNVNLATLQADDIAGARAIYGLPPATIQPPQIAKSYSSAAIELSIGTSNVLITVNNPNSTTLTGIVVDDTLPAGVAFVPATLSHTCAGATVSINNGTRLQLTGFSLVASASCQITIRVVGTALGTFSTSATAAASQSGSSFNLSNASLIVTPVSTGGYCAVTSDTSWTGARAIRGGVPNIVTSTITVPDAGSIVDLDIALGIEHTWMGDLEVTLSHNGTTVSLLNQPNNGAGNCAGNNAYVTLDDEAGAAVQTQCVISNGSSAYGINGLYTPVSPLSAFDGQPLNGTWTLQILDDFLTSDNGYLVNWCLDESPRGRNLLRNPDFSLPTSTQNGTLMIPFWGVWADIVYRVQNGLFEFYRVANTISAELLQNTGEPLPAGAPIELSFDLGNSSALRKRVVVLPRRNNFRDTQICSFWLEPNAPMRTYRMQMRTTIDWDQAALSIYDSTGNGGQWIQVDNVVMDYRPDLTIDSTRCIDPTAPAQVTGNDGLNLIVNGGFSAGVNGWLFDGQITGNVVVGVYQHYRNNDPVNTRGGVIFQESAAAMPDNAPLEAQFQLGNSHPTDRQRATVLIYDSNFTDLQACVFWIAPNTPLQTYVIRTHTTRAWARASIAFYPNPSYPTEPAGRMLLDNISLRYRPGMLVTGTNCYPPGSVIAGQAPSVPEVIPQAWIDSGLVQREALGEGVEIAPASAEFPTMLDPAAGDKPLEAVLPVLELPTLIPTGIAAPIVEATPFDRIIPTSEAPGVGEGG